MPFPTQGDLPDPGIKPAPFVSPALAGGFFTTSATWREINNREDPDGGEESVGKGKGP